MFTPQRKAPWTPTTAAPRTEPRPVSRTHLIASSHDTATTSKTTAAAAFFDTPPTPPPTSSLGGLGSGGFDGADSDDWRKFKEVGLLDESALEKKDRQATLDRISRLEKELFDYQYNMGLLLIEKNKLVSKTEELGQEVSEAMEILKRERAAHLIAISEAEKREENLKKALNLERKSLADLERALRDMHEEHAKTKATADTTMTDLSARMEELHKQTLDVKKKSYSADAKLAELDRKNSELDRKLQDLEDREDILQREQLSLTQERESHDSYFRKQKEDLLLWEKKLEEGEQRLCESRRILNEREEKLHETDVSSKAMESNVEELQKKIDLANATLKKVENDVKNQLEDLDMKEKNSEAMRYKLEVREKHLQEEEERLNFREEVELEKLLNEHKAMLDSKMQEFELEMKEKRSALEEELNSRKEAVDHKETEINHLDMKLSKREQALEKKSERMKEKEKDIEVKNKTLKEQEKCLKAEDKRLEKEKKEIIAELENLEILKKEIDKLKDDAKKQELHIEEERKNLEVAENERLEYLRLQSSLKQEMNNVRRQWEIVEKEAAELKLEREKFENEWEALDEKRAFVDKELKTLAETKAYFENLRKSEEERLEREKAENEERFRLEAENIRLQKESFEATMEHEKLMLAEKSNKEHALMCQDFEQQKQDLYVDMQKRREEWGKQVEEKEKALEETRLINMRNVKNMKEDAERKREEMEIERHRMDKEREELELNKKQLEENGLDIAKDIEALDKLSKKLKKQRVQLVCEREHFGALIEKIKCCKSCGDSVQAFLRGDLQLPTAEGSSQLLKLSHDDQAKDDFASFADLNKAKSSLPGGNDRELPQLGGQMSVLRKCASIIFHLSPKKGIQNADNHVMEQSPHSATNIQANDHVGGQTSVIDEVNVKSCISITDKPGPALETLNDADNSQLHVREDNFENSLTVDEFDIDSEVQSIKETEISDLKNGQKKPGRRRGAVRRTHSVKAVVEDAKAILRDGSAGNMEQSKDSLGANVNNQEKTLHAYTTTTSARKRSRSQASKVTESEQDVDHSEGNADSVSTVSRRKRRQTVASAQPTPGQKRYNLRRHAAAASSGKPENEDEVTHKATNQAVENPDETPSKSLDVTVDSDKRLHLVQVSTTMSVELSSDRCHATTSLAENHVVPAKLVENASCVEEVKAADDTLSSQEVNETSEQVEEDSRSMVSENEEDEDEDDMDEEEEDDDDDHPGPGSIRNKLWKFLTS